VAGCHCLGIANVVAKEIQDISYRTYANLSSSVSRGLMGCNVAVWKEFLSIDSTVTLPFLVIYATQDSLSLNQSS
jgi:hypothetical protein